MYIQIEVKPVKCNFCAYQWYYKGKNEYVAHCPHCRHYVNIQKQMIDIKQKENYENIGFRAPTLTKFKIVQGENKNVNNNKNGREGTTDSRPNETGPLQNNQQESTTNYD